MLSATGPLGSNPLEVLAATLFLAALVAACLRAGWSRRDAAVAALLILPVVLLTAAEATQFLTNDEQAIATSLHRPDQRALEHLARGAFLTGLALALPLVRLLATAGIEQAAATMLLKAAWWLAGNALVAAIAAAVLASRDPGAPARPARPARPATLAAGFAALTLLPTTQLAIKTLNYDLFALGFGTLAIVLATRAALERRRDLGWYALVAASLAAHEKLTAGPVLIAVVAVRSLLDAEGALGAPGRARAAMRSAAASLAVAVLLGGALLLLYRLLGPPEAPPEFWLWALNPVSTWAWVGLRLLVPVDTILAWRAAIALAFLPAWVLGMGALAALWPATGRLGARVRRLPPRALALAPFALLALLLLVGVVSTRLVTPFWAPYTPTPLRLGLAMQELNRATLHFGATTAAGHVASAVAYALEVVVVATPTALWLLALAALLRSRRAGRHPSDAVTGAATAWLAAALALPLATALVGIPFAHRYFSLPLALVACAVLRLALPALAPAARRGPGRALPAVLLVAALVVEVAPFRPLFAAFRPFWLALPGATRAEPGRINPSWMGWGEDVLRIGKDIERACRTGDPVLQGMPCESITLYVAHSGAWLPGPSRIRLVAIARLRGVLPLDARSFYLMNRLALVQRAYPVPEVAPDFVDSARGFELAWAFRGDRLAASGYRFRPEQPASGPARSPAGRSAGGGRARNRRRARPCSASSVPLTPGKDCRVGERSARPECRAWAGRPGTEPALVLPGLDPGGGTG